MVSGTVATEREQQRLRAAENRRGRPELRLAGNRGQRRLVAERDLAIRRALSQGGLQIGSLLEIGCGDGSVVAGLCAHGIARRGAGIDLLEEHVDRARRDYPSLDFRVGDAAELPFGDATFDAVLASTVLSSVTPGPRRLAILREVDRVLRPGGIFCWYDMRVRSPSNPDVRPFTSAEIRAALPGYMVQSRSLTLAPPIARRLGPLTPIAYPVLVAVPLLRTHTVGTARKR